jgi:NADH-ubiquinone oxidoreductase chain 5
MRSSPLLEYTPTILVACLWIGGLTTLVSGLIAIASNDIKRVIAYSTMSQLGMMLIGLGLSAYNIALFHLFCHAFFKALLFMSAGAIIHSIASESQDFRKYGGLIHFLPFTYVCIFIASLSLMAFPGLTGFYSKDIIIESVYGSFSISGIIIYWLSVTSATLTSIYSIRILYLTFLSAPNAPRSIYTKVHEPGLFMTIPMIILAILSIFIGYIAKDFFLGLGSNTMVSSSLFTHPDNLILPDVEFGVPTFFKLLPLFTSVSFSIMFIVLYEYFPLLHKTVFIKSINNNILNDKPTFAYKIYTFFNQKFYFDALLNNVIIRGGLNVAGILNKSIDKGSLQYIGPKGLEYCFTFISKKFTILDSGIIKLYASYILTFTILIILSIFFGGFNTTFTLFLIFVGLPIIFQKVSV